VTSAQLAARCVELLGEIDGPVVVVTSDGLRAALADRLRVARDDEMPVAAVCAFLGETGEPEARHRRLALLAGRLPPGAPIVVVDHNRPRTWWRRAYAGLGLVLQGLAPGRARHPVARELRDHGFAIERLRLAAGERVQLVVGRRA
jgi:hypothetical protein